MKEKSMKTIIMEMENRNPNNKDSIAFRLNYIIKKRRYNAKEVAALTEDKTKGLKPISPATLTMDKLFYINNLLPGGVKLAYMAHAMYGDLFDREWADGILKQYIDLGTLPLEGQTLDSILAFIQFSDYKAAAGIA